MFHKPFWLWTFKSWQQSWWIAEAARLAISPLISTSGPSITAQLFIIALKMNYGTNIRGIQSSSKSIFHSFLSVKGAHRTGAIGVVFIKISKVNSWTNLFCPFSFPLSLKKEPTCTQKKSVCITKRKKEKEKKDEKENGKISMGATVWFQIKSVSFMREMCSSELIWVGGKATRLQQTNQIFKFYWRYSGKSSVEPQLHEKLPSWGEKHFVYCTFSSILHSLKLNVSDAEPCGSVWPNGSMMFKQENLYLLT